MKDKNIFKNVLYYGSCIGYSTGPAQIVAIPVIAVAGVVAGVAALKLGVDYYIKKDMYKSEVSVRCAVVAGGIALFSLLAAIPFAGSIAGSKTCKYLIIRITDKK